MAEPKKWFARFAWAVLAYNIPVILWGAYVRVSFSGDGCGANWPLCGGGQVIPQHMATPRLIEFTHRVMTGGDLVLAIALILWAFLAWPKGHSVRRYASFSMLFLLIEALLGAGLVLFRLVAHDQSAGRALYLSLHLTNTLLLLGALTATAWAASRREPTVNVFQAPKTVLAGLAVAVIVSISGAIAALGDTLFPSTSIAAGVQQDFSSASATLLRLRVFHPALAVLGAAYLIWMTFHFLKNQENNPERTAALSVMMLALFQVLVGAANFSLLAPVWMQLFHLFTGDLLWIALVVLSLETARGWNPARAFQPQLAQTNRLQPKES